MHSCRSRSARGSTAVLRHRVSSTRSHSPGPLPSLIHPVYWPVQSLLNPQDHPRYLLPYRIDRTRPGPGGYRRVSRERGPVLLGSQSLLNPRDHPRYLPPYPIDRTRPGPRCYWRVSRERVRSPRLPCTSRWSLSVCGDKQGRARRLGQFEKENRNKINKKVKSF